VAPLVFLAQKLMEVTNHPSTLLGTGKSQVTSTVLIGAKTKSALLCEKEFKDLGYDVKIATEDGSRGHKGFITEVLNKILVTCDYGLTTIYACGPKPMLKAAAAIAARHKIPCQVLLEEYMACGLGACLGCAVKVKTHDARRTTHDEYKMVCKDGPVFKAGEIIWE
jgi:dihydroorotate dehydrogenase electron transfer subunit